VDRTCTGLYSLKYFFNEGIYTIIHLVIANRTCATLREDENAHKISSENLSGMGVRGSIVG
jgi:hypothetical protein